MSRKIGVHLIYRGYPYGHDSVRFPLRPLINREGFITELGALSQWSIDTKSGSISHNPGRLPEMHLPLHSYTLRALPKFMES